METNVSPPLPRRPSSWAFTGEPWTDIAPPESPPPSAGSGLPESPPPSARGGLLESPPRSTMATFRAGAQHSETTSETTSLTIPLVTKVIHTCIHSPEAYVPPSHGAPPLGQRPLADGGRGRASSVRPRACPPLGCRTPSSSATARRPRTRAAEGLLAGRSRGRRCTPPARRAEAKATEPSGEKVRTR